MTAVALHDPNTQPQQRHLSVIQDPPLPPIAAGFFDAAGFDLMQRIAKGFSSSTLVPQEYRGATPAAIGNCMIALNLARRIGADPLMVMQNLSIVQGRPSWSSQFLIASVNTCGRFSALRFEFFGEKGQPSWGCRASAVEKATGEVLVGSDITWELAQKEGWTKRGGSKWMTMPQQMFIYRSGAWWVKAYAPEISMGLMTADESHDVGAVEYRELRREPSAARSSSPRTINARLEASPLQEVANEPETGPIIDDEIPDFGGADSHASSAAAEAPAQGTGAGEPASSIQDGDAGIPSQEQKVDLSPVDEARQAGREACEAGIDFKDIPAKYTKYTSYKKAWEQGYQAQAEEMGA